MEHFFSNLENYFFPIFPSATLQSNNEIPNQSNFLGLRNYRKQLEKCSCLYPFNFSKKIYSESKRHILYRGLCHKNGDTFFALPSNTKLAILGSTKKESETFKKNLSRLRRLYIEHKYNYLEDLSKASLSILITLLPNFLKVVFPYLIILQT